MLDSNFSKLFDELMNLQKNLHRLRQRQNLRNILKIVGIGFFLYRHIQAEIENNIALRKTLLERIFSEALSKVDYFGNEIFKIKKSATYLPTEKETYFLSLIREFEKELAYLKVLDTERQIAISEALAKIVGFQTFISNYNLEIEKKQLNEQLLKLKNDVLHAETEFKSLYDGSNYFSKRELYDWKEKWGSLARKIEEYTKKTGFEVNFSESIKFVISAFRNGENWLENRNKEYVKQEIVRFDDFFNKVEKKPLTLEQKKAIATDEENNLVVAGAGTGKTSTIVGKAGYLVKKGLAKPEEILLLSFNKHVYKELEQRIESRLKKKLKVFTYHSFGLQVIREASQTPIEVSPLAEDKAMFTKKIHDFITNRMKDTAFAELINEYFLYYFVPYKSEFEFTSFKDYVEYLKQVELRALKGDKVKSFEECFIANFLFISGIKYEYEKPYEIREFDLNHNNRQYRPDFYLPEYHLYIEHFGIDRNGKTAPFVPLSEYNRQMQWKLDIHARYNTQLIQTFSYEHSEGTLLTNLEKKLKEKGVVFKPMAKEQIFLELEALGRISLFSRLIGNFLNLYKSSGKSISEITNQVDADDARTRTFLKMFSAVYDNYTSFLNETGEIDFNDMLNEATKYILSRQYVSSFKYILVDEFQDISNSRYLFLKALLSQNKAKLFAVGDDWQSIYRFTGSDISLMVYFEKNFGFSERCLLQESFRLNDKLCKFSTKFVTQNRLQIKKDIKGSVQDSEPSVSVIRGNTGQKIREILKEISMKSDKEQKVFIIGRYNRLKEEHLNGLPKLPFLNVEFSTAHKSKGREAEYVILTE